MIDASFSFEAKKYALRQAKDGVVVSFLVHPADVVPELLSAAIGEHYVVALAPYEEKAAEVERQPAPEPIPEPEKPKERRPFHTLPRSQQAAILINDAAFQWWVGSNRTPAETDQMIKAHMGIASKRDLDQPGHALKWDRLVEEFSAASGRATWERPA